MAICNKFGLTAPALPKESNFVTDSRCVGIEIEQEYGSSGYNKLLKSYEKGYIDSRWNLKRDGSLRGNGIEFVSTVMYPGDVEDSIDSVMDLVSEGTSSWRCAIHVHVDARDLTESQLFTIGELYALMEPLIFKWEGNQRHTSRFCIPWFNSVDAIQEVYSVINKDRRSIQRNLERFGKYSALNLMPIMSFGSIEFRHMQTVPNKQKLMQYVDLCLSIVEVGASGINPLLELSSRGTDEFISYMFDGRLDFLIQSPADCDLLWDGIDTANAVNVAEASISTIPKSPAAIGLGYIDMIFDKQTKEGKAE